MHLRTHIAKRISQRISRDEAELILDYAVNEDRMAVVRRGDSAHLIQRLRASESMPLLRKVMGKGDVAVLTVGDHVITTSNCTSRNR